MANEPFCVILVGKCAGVIALDFNLKKEANMSEQESIRVVEEILRTSQVPGIVIALTKKDSAQIAAFRDLLGRESTMP